MRYGTAFCGLNVSQIADLLHTVKDDLRVAEDHARARCKKRWARCQCPAHSGSRSWGHDYGLCYPNSSFLYLCGGYEDELCSAKDYIPRNSDAIQQYFEVLFPRTSGYRLEHGSERQGSLEYELVAHVFFAAHGIMFEMASFLASDRPLICAGGKSQLAATLLPTMLSFILLSPLLNMKFVATREQQFIALQLHDEMYWNHDLAIGICMVVWGVMDSMWLMGFCSDWSWVRCVHEQPAMMKDMYILQAGATSLIFLTAFLIWPPSVVIVWEDLLKLRLELTVMMVTDSLRLVLVAYCVCSTLLKAIWLVTKCVEARESRVYAVDQPSPGPDPAPCAIGQPSPGPDPASCDPGSSSLAWQETSEQG